MLFRVDSVCFGCFEFYTKTASFDVSIEPKQTEDQPKQFDREHILVFFRKCRVVLVRFDLKQFCLFRLFQYRYETPKQTENLSFGFTKQTETDLVSVCFGSNPNFYFVSRTPLQ